jgi:putative transposase
MGKLNPRKIKWIIRKKTEGYANQRIAMGQKISSRRVRQIFSAYRKTGQIPALSKVGRKPKILPIEQQMIIIEAYDKFLVGPVGLEKVIQRHYGMRISHNAIYRFMKGRGMVENSPSKKKQRKWVRYERKHSLSLVHVDWSELNGKHIISFLDDASRMVIAYGEFSNATGEVTIKVLIEADQFAKSYGGIRQILSDRGGQFKANKLDKKGKANHCFENALANLGIGHVLSGVNHPQTNGKLEKWFDAYKKRRGKFASIDEFMHWYNDLRPHMSLNFNKAETPSEAFIRKIRTEVWLGYVKDWFD